jgi:carbamoyl-phosphate synthase large subunit
MNILLTCAGRRSYLVKYFKVAVGKSGHVFTANSNINATAMLVSDGAIIAPPIHKKEYINFIKEICVKYDIKLVVSLFDMELPILAKHRLEIEKLGVKLAVSDPEVVKICNDKMATIKFVKKLKLKTLFTTTNIKDALKKIKSRRVSFPLFVKPRFGVGSIAVQQAENEKELDVLYKKVKKDINKTYLKYDSPMISNKKNVIIQESARGQEYGLDIVNDFNGNYVATFVKRKIAMRSGETDIAETENNEDLKEIGRKIGANLKHIGILDADIFWDGKKTTILEMNPRFGGGYLFSHLAGANIPKAYIKWLEGEKKFSNCFRIKYGVRGFKNLNLLKRDSAKLIETYEEKN